MTRTRNIVTTGIILIVITIALMVSSISYAVWHSGSGENMASISVDDSYTDWNASAKYFTFESLDASGVPTMGTAASYAITGYSGNLQDVILPNAYNDKPVTKINDTIFSGVKSVVITIKIPSTITEIVAGAFSNLTNLKEVYFYANPTCSIGNFVFTDCSSLEKAQILGGASFINNPLWWVGCPISSFS